MQRWQILSSCLGDYPKLVIRYHLEQRFSKLVQALHILWRRTPVLGLMVLTQGIDGLLDQRLACLDHPYKGALVQNAMPCPVDELSIGPVGSM